MSLPSVPQEPSVVKKTLTLSESDTESDEYELTLVPESDYNLDFGDGKNCALKTGDFPKKQSEMETGPLNPHVPQNSSILEEDLFLSESSESDGASLEPENRNIAPRLPKNFDDMLLYDGDADPEDDEEDARPSQAGDLQDAPTVVEAGHENIYKSKSAQSEGNTAEKIPVPPPKVSSFQAAGSSSGRHLQAESNPFLYDMFTPILKPMNMTRSEFFAASPAFNAPTSMKHLPNLLDLTMKDNFRSRESIKKQVAGDDVIQPGIQKEAASPQIAGVSGMGNSVQEPHCSSDKVEPPNCKMRTQEVVPDLNAGTAVDGDEGEMEDVDETVIVKPRSEKLREDPRGLVTYVDLDVPEEDSRKVFHKPNNPATPRPKNAPSRVDIPKEDSGKVFHKANNPALPRLESISSKDISGTRRVYRAGPRDQIDFKVPRSDPRSILRQKRPFKAPHHSDKVAEGFRATPTSGRSIWEGNNRVDANPSTGFPKKQMHPWAALMNIERLGYDFHWITYIARDKGNLTEEQQGHLYRCTIEQIGVAKGPTKVKAVCESSRLEVAKQGAAASFVNEMAKTHKQLQHLTTEVPIDATQDKEVFNSLREKLECKVRKPVNFQTFTKIDTVNGRTTYKFGIRVGQDEFIGYSQKNYLLARCKATEKVYQEVLKEPVPRTPIFVGEACAQDDSGYRPLQSCAYHGFDISSNADPKPVINEPQTQREGGRGIKRKINITRHDLPGPSG